MKKLAFSTIILLCILGIAGCSGRVKTINIKNISASTILAKSNGEIQVASIEDFDKPYYKLSDLQNFVNQQISDYNKKAGSDKIKMNNIKIYNKKAVLLLTYSGMDQYAAFNKVTAAYFNGGVKDNPLDLPTTLVNAKDESLASTKEVIQDEAYKVLVLNEHYNIVVDGKVKYYSENATLIDSNEVQSAADGMTIVVFKP
jgi:hypothetical protein